jgi:hypothetical protein
MLHFKEGRNPTLAENKVYIELARMTDQWLITDYVSKFPKSAGGHYAVTLFREARSVNPTRNWFIVSGLPHFMWTKWGLPCTEINGNKMSTEWHSKVQGGFFRGVLEAYTELLMDNYVFVGDMAYPMNSTVPRPRDVEMAGGDA